MKRTLVALLALTVVLLPVPKADGQTARPAQDVGAPGNVPFSELPACNPGPFDQARSNAEHAPDPSSSRAKVCVAEKPESVPSTLAGGDVPPPSATGYHFIGNQTTTQAHWQGMRQKQRIVNPNVCHGSGCLGTGQNQDFVASWEMIAALEGSDRFIQAGWSENGSNWGIGSNGENVRHVFTYNTQYNNWNFYPGFNLVDGSTLSTLTKHTATGFGWQYTNYVFWNGVWVQLDSAWLDIDPNTNHDKVLEGYTEVYVTPGGTDTHPQWDGSGYDGIRMNNRQWYNAAFGWIDFATSDLQYPSGYNVPGPPFSYYLFLNGSQLDQTVCTEQARADC